MDIKEMGKLIHTLRVKGGISQHELCSGICSISTLSRLELGECRPNFFIFNALLQRLGKSADYINIVLTLEEFEFIMGKWNVEQAILAGDCKKAEKELALLEKRLEASILKAKVQSLQRQDIYRLYAFLLFCQGAGYEKVLSWVCKALQETIPNFNEAEALLSPYFANLYFSKSELQLLLLYVCLREHMGREESQLLENIISYIHFRITDKRAQSEELSQALYIKAYLHKRKSNWKKCYRCCEDAIDAEMNVGRVHIMFQILEIEVECLRHGRMEGRDGLRQKQHKHLKAVLESYMEHLPKRNEFLFFLQGDSQEKELIDEVVLFSRFRSGYSQGELCEGICSPENLSRVETGRHNPTVRNFCAIMEKTGIEMGYYNTEFVVEQFESLEKIGELRYLTIWKNFAAADELLEELEKEIDAKSVRNQQQIGLYHTVFDYRLGKITLEEGLERIQRLLGLTLKGRDRKFFMQFQLTFTEVSLMNQMAVYSWRLGKQKMAVKILKYLYDFFHQSKLEAPWRSKKYFMVLGNLSSYLEEEGDLEQAFKVAEEALAAGIKYNTGLRLGSNLIIKASVQERMGIEECLENFECSYYICGLFKDFNNQKKVGEYLAEKWKIRYED